MPAGNVGLKERVESGDDAARGSGRPATSATSVSPRAGIDAAAAGGIDVGVVNTPSMGCVVAFGEPSMDCVDAFGEPSMDCTDEMAAPSGCRSRANFSIMEATSSRLWTKKKMEIAEDRRKPTAVLIARVA